MTEKKHNINKRKRKSLPQSTQVVPTILGTTYPTYGLPVELNLFDNGGTLKEIAAANKSANPWDYVEDKNTVDLFLSTDAGKAYANSKNTLGISKKFNPFSKMNLAGKGALGSLGKAGIGALAGAVGGFANKAISGGFSSGAGAGISSVGSTIGGLVSNVNPVIGGAVTLASNVVGGLVNRAFGSKVNEKALLEANAGTAQLNNFVSNAGNFDSVQGVQPVANIGTVYEGGWFNKSDARRKQAELERKRLNALTFAYNSVENNVNNLQEDQMDNMLRNFAAYGGGLDIDPTSPIGYSLYTDKLAKDINKDNSSNVNMFAGMPNAMFDLGGILQTNGSNWGNAIHIDAGGSHEANPNDGVQIGADSLGIPNLVEENELIYNDYVFSDRLIVPKGKRGKYGKRGNKYAKGGNLLDYDKQVLKPLEGLTFAEAAKKIEKQSGVNERPNDPIAKRTFEANLSILARNLEKEREKEKLKEMLDAIDKMSPEDFMAMQQQALQLQLVINPAFMPLLALALQPLMAAYGGKLFAKGGNTDDESTSTPPPTTSTTSTTPSPAIVAWLLKNYAGKFKDYEAMAKRIEDNLKKDKDYKENMSQKDLDKLYGTVFDAMKNGTIDLRQTPSKLKETPVEESPRVLKDGYEEEKNARMEQEMRELEERFALQNMNFVPIEEIEAQRKKEREERAKAPKATLTIKMDKALPASIRSNNNVDPNLLKPNINVEVPTSTTTPTTSQNVVRLFLDTEALAKRDEEIERQKLELQLVEDLEANERLLDPFKGKSMEEMKAAFEEQLRLNREASRATLSINMEPMLPMPIPPVENNLEPNINTDELINRAPVDVPQSEVLRIREAVANNYQQNAMSAPDYNIPLQEVPVNNESPISYTPDSSLGYENIQKIYEDDQEKPLREVLRPSKNHINYKKNFREWWNKNINTKILDPSIYGIRAYGIPPFNIDWGKVYTSISGKEGKEKMNSVDTYNALEELYRLNPSMFTDYDNKNYTFKNAGQLNNITELPLVKSLENTVEIPKDETNNALASINEYVNNPDNVAIIEPLEEILKLIAREKSPMLTNIYRMLNAPTDSDITRIAKEKGLNELDLSKLVATDYGNDIDAWRKNVFSNDTFKKAIDNPALTDAISRGYDFGMFTPEENKAGYSFNDEFWNNPNSDSKQAGNTSSTYKPSPFVPTDRYKTIEDLLNSDEYKAFTDYIINKADDATRLKYFKWLDDNTGNTTNKYIVNGLLADSWQNKYTNARNDGLNGIVHLQPNDMAPITRGSKGMNLVLKDDGTWETILTDVPKDWTLLNTYSWKDKDNDYTYNYYKRPTKTPVVEKPDGTKGKSTSTNDNFPKAPMWPYYAGLGLLGLGLLHNWLTPVDYSNANAVIKAARNAGNYKPVGFNPIGNYLTYKPMDIWFELNRQNANSRATDRLLANSGSQGSRAANILANTYNSLLASGDLYRKALEYNDAQKKSVEEFNRDTDKFNREGFLQADLANLKALQGAAALTLEGLKSGYAMRQAAEDAKSNAISAGLTGLSSGLYNLAQSLYGNDLIGWKLRHNPNPISLYEGSETSHASKGGKLRIRRKRRLSF